MCKCLSKKGIQWLKLFDVKEAILVKLGHNCRFPCGKLLFQIELLSHKL